MKMELFMLWKLCFSLVLILRKTCTADTDNQYRALKEFEELLDSMVADNGLFDGVGSIDVAVWRRNMTTGETRPFFSNALGKSQVKKIAKRLVNLTDYTRPSSELKEIAHEELPVLPDVPATKYGDHHNQYRIASITKTFMGYIVDYLRLHNNLDIDAKVNKINHLTFSVP